MSGQEQWSKRKSSQEADDEVLEAQPQTNPDAAERKEALNEDIDSILDEIDDVLETNAEDFVKSFIQKGGQ